VDARETGRADGDGRVLDALEGGRIDALDCGRDALDGGRIDSLDGGRPHEFALGLTFDALEDGLLLDALDSGLGVDALELDALEGGWEAGFHDEPPLVEDGNMRLVQLFHKTLTIRRGDDEIQVQSAFIEIN
jgi:hypothetical protein